MDCYHLSEEKNGSVSQPSLPPDVQTYASKCMFSNHFVLDVPQAPQTYHIEVELYA